MPRYKVIWRLRPDEFEAALNKASREGWLLHTVLSDFAVMENWEEDEEDA